MRISLSVNNRFYDFIVNEKIHAKPSSIDNVAIENIIRGLLVACDAWYYYWLERLS